MWITLYKNRLKIFNTWCLIKYLVYANFPAYTCSLRGCLTFRDVVHFDEFLSLNVDQICKLISSDRLTVVTEEQVKVDNSLHSSESLSETLNDVECILLNINFFPNGKCFFFNISVITCVGLWGRVVMGTAWFDQSATRNWPAARTCPLASDCPGIPGTEGGGGAAGEDQQSV